MSELVLVGMHHYRYNGQMADGGQKLTVYLPELAPGEVASLISGSMKAGYVAFKPNQIQLDELPKRDAPIDEGFKTPSQRLRGVLYKIWETRGSHGDFDTFYRQQVGKIIDRLKDDLQ